MAAAFVEAISGLTVPLNSLQSCASRPTFPEFYSSSFAIFALSPKISNSDLQAAADTANAQAYTELGFTDAELAETADAAAVPSSWQRGNGEPADVVRWYHREFREVDDEAEPLWYPLGFLGIVDEHWREEGVVLVFYDALPRHPGNQNVAVKAYTLDSSKIGVALISFRQGDDSFENIKKHSVLS